ncbi:MAG: hypothetical protein PVJ07_09880 [Anaerolineales bacterium]|jgi:DNA-binding beta-propeller fold protein YncE
MMRTNRTLFPLGVAILLLLSQIACGDAPYLAPDVPLLLPASTTTPTLPSPPIPAPSNTATSIPAPPDTPTPRPEPTEALPTDFYVWVIEDTDPDWEDPPFDDTLTIIDVHGSVVHTGSGFHVLGGFGGGRPIAVFPDGSSALVVEGGSISARLYPDLPATVTRLDLSGTAIWSVELAANAADLSSSGDAYVLTDAGNIHGDSILLLDPEDGSIIREEDFGGIDLVVDDTHDAVWIVGSDIDKLNLNLEHQFTTDPIEWAAFSVDFSSDGSVWVGEGEHPDVPGSARNLLKISPDGETLQTIPLEGRPYCIAVDRSDDSVWVATHQGAQKFDQNGSSILIIDDPARCVRVSQRDGSVWVAFFHGTVVRYSRDGIELATTSGFQNDDKWIDVP